MIVFIKPCAVLLMLGNVKINICNNYISDKLISASVVVFGWTMQMQDVTPMKNNNYIKFINNDYCIFCHQIMTING